MCIRDSTWLVVLPPIFLDSTIMEIGIPFHQGADGILLGRGMKLAFFFIRVQRCILPPIYLVSTNMAIGIFSSQGRWSKCTMPTCDNAPIRIFLTLISFTFDLSLFTFVHSLRLQLPRSLPQYVRGRREAPSGSLVLQPLKTLSTARGGANKISSNKFVSLDILISSFLLTR